MTLGVPVDWALDECEKQGLKLRALVLEERSFGFHVSFGDRQMIRYITNLEYSRFQARRSEEVIVRLEIQVMADELRKESNGR